MTLQSRKAENTGLQVRVVFIYYISLKFREKVIEISKEAKEYSEGL